MQNEKFLFKFCILCGIFFFPEVFIRDQSMNWSQMSTCTEAIHCSVTVVLALTVVSYTHRPHSALIFTHSPLLTLTNIRIWPIGFCKRIEGKDGNEVVNVQILQSALWQSFLWHQWVKVPTLRTMRFYLLIYLEGYRMFVYKWPSWNMICGREFLAGINPVEVAAVPAILTSCFGIGGILGEERDMVKLILQWHKSSKGPYSCGVN